MKLTEHDFYYFRSIKRNLDSLVQTTEGPSLASEVVSDNRDWLDSWLMQNDPVYKRRRGITSTKMRTNREQKRNVHS